MVCASILFAVVFAGPCGPMAPNAVNMNQRRTLKIAFQSAASSYYESAALPLS